MSEGEAAGGPELQEAEAAPATAPVRPTTDPALLLAVERVGADVAALSRGLASQPEEVAARLDVDAATAAVGVRVGALGSALDQLRLSMLAALDRSSDRVDAPAWLPDLQASLAAVEQSTAERPGVESVLEAIRELALGERLDQLNATVAGMAADRSNLDEIVTAVTAADPGERLARVEHAVAALADGVRAGAAVGDALEDLGQRLASIEDAAGRVADDARVLLERVAPVPDRLTAIASQVDRITPLARAGDQAGTLFDRLDHVGGSLVEVLALLRERGVTGGDDVDDRFEGVVDVLAGVARRQDEVTAAIASVLDQVRGPKGVDAVLERMEQRERSLAARLDRIDAGLRRTGGAGPGSSVEAWEKPDAGGEGLTLATVLERMERQQETVATHLDWVGERLSEVAAHLVPEPTADDQAGSPVGIAAVFDRMEQRERSLAARLDRIDAELRRMARGAPAGPGTVAPTGAAERDPDDGAGGSLATSVESIAAITGELARLIESTAERLDRRLARVESMLQAPRGPATPASPATPPEGAALRLAELRAERALVQARLQEERLLAAQSRDDES